MQMKSSGWKKILRWLPGVLISLIAIYAVLKFIKMDDLKNAFQTVKPLFIFIIFGIDILGLLVRGKAWQVILGEKVSFSQAFFGVCEGYFLNNVLPFRAGEIGRSFFVGRNTGKGTLYVLSTIVIERAFDVAFAAGLVMLTLPFIIGMDWIKPIATIALLLVIAGMILLFFIARNNEKVMAWVNNGAHQSRIMKFVIPRIQNILDGFSLLAKPSQFFLSLFWIAVNWLVWTSVYFIAVKEVISTAPYWWGAFISGVMALGVAIPSAPSALGVYEASFVGAIAILGGQTGTALAYAIIMHLVQFAVSAIFGIWGLFREGMSFSKIFSSFSGESLKSVPIENGNEGL